MNRFYFSLALAAVLSVLSACSSDSDNDSTTTTTTSSSSDSGGSTGGSGTDSETVEGLTLPESMSIVPAQDDSESASGVGGLAFNGGAIAASLAGFAYDDPDTDYSQDRTRTYVYDRSMESLSIVNMILCLMDQTGATEMVNQGAYIALVNEDKCEQGENQSSAGSTGQSSGSQATQYNSWTINSTRESNTAPQEVVIWVPGEAPSGEDTNDVMGSETIIINLTINEGATDENPFGDFVMNFKGVIDASLMGGAEGTEVEVMHGILQTVDNAEGKLQFSMFNAGGDRNDSALNAGFGFEEAVNVVMDDVNGTAGSAITRNFEEYTSPEGFSESKGGKFAISFDTGNLHRGWDDNDDNTIDEQMCLSRTNFNTQVWRYNLYHFTDGTFNGKDVVEGQRVKLNSGFPFKYDTDDDGNADAYGYAGYHGVWTETGDVSDGQTIVEFNHQDETQVEHAVNISNGRMIRRTAEQEPLSSFRGDEFMYWGMHPELQMFGEWLITIDENNDFQLTHTFSWGENGMVRSTTIDHDGDADTAEVSVAAGLTFQNGDMVWLWSDALGGNVNYVQDDTVAAANRQVTFFGQEFVFPGDATLFANGNSVTLYCYERCLKGGLTQADVDAANSDMELFYEYQSTPFEYTVSSSNGKLVLTDAGNDQEVSAAALDMSGIGNDWGVNTGELVTQQLPLGSNPWEVFDQETTYRFETGSNEWNQTVTIADANGTVKTFDKPLRFVYTHTTANDANGSEAHNNKKFQLEYNGPGDLWGFPWVEDEDNGRWYAAATLKNGVQLTDPADDTVKFVVKQVEREQTMRQADASACSDLEISGLLSDPDFALPGSDDLNDIDTTLADKPSVSAAPAVIEGELQN